MKRLGMLVSMVAVAALCLPALAQDDRPPRGERPRMGQRISDEKREAAWTWQAKGVAKQLELDEETTGKLTDAYLAARRSMQEAMQEFRRSLRDARGSGEGRGRGAGRGGGPGVVQDDRQDAPPRGRRAGMREEMQKIREAEQEKFKKSIADFLEEEQLKTAVKTLGSFSGQWDRLVVGLIDLKLEDEKMYAALKPVQAYAMKLEKARESDERGAMREAMQEGRTELEDALGELLTEEQMNAFRQSMRPDRGRRPRGGGRGLDGPPLS